MAKKNSLTIGSTTCTAPWFPEHMPGECPELAVFREFRESIERAEGESEVEAVAQLRKHMPRSVKAIVTTTSPRSAA